MPLAPFLEESRGEGSLRKKFGGGGWLREAGRGEVTADEIFRGGERHREF